jgi:oxygen-dependent protoporphyrinogen oxidase
MIGRAVVVGAGVAGLASAYRLLQADPALDVTVLESGDAPGGRLTSAAVGDLELEAGPDSFVARRPWAVELCRELGLELVEPGVSGTFVWTDHGLERFPETALGVPADLERFARWPGMSRAGRLRALRDILKRPAPPPGDESLGGLVRRRLGHEAAEVLVQPLLGGLFGGDIDGLGVQATFPELARWERDYGGLIRGARASLGLARSAGPMFLKPKRGVSALPDALAAAIGPERIRLRTPASAIASDGQAFVVSTPSGQLQADAVVLATAGFAAAELLAEVAPAAAEPLALIPYASTGVVLLVYPSGTGAGLPEATGFVVPNGKAPMTAATFVSRKWPSPQHGDRAVLRCFVGGIGAEDVLDAPDAEIVEAVCRHLAAALPLPQTPEAVAVVRWPRSMPQYGVGHVEIVEAIEGSLPGGIVVAGNAYRGVGVADTVRSANDAAERVRAHLAGEAAPSEREHAR